MDIQDIRRENLQYIVTTQGLSSAARQFGKPDRQLNDMLKKRKSFGEEVARQMEEKYAEHAPKGWLDIEDRTFYDNSKFGIRQEFSTAIGIKPQQVTVELMECTQLFVQANEKTQKDAKNILVDGSADRSEKSGKGNQGK